MDDVRYKHPECQDMAARRIVGSMEWCAVAFADRRMPAWVFADLLISARDEAERFRVWPRVCATLIARGHRIFAKFLPSEVPHAS